MTRTCQRALALLAAGCALWLTGCGSPQVPEAAGPPVVLSSGAPSSSATAVPRDAGATATTGGAAPVAADVRDRGADLEAEDQAGAGRTVRVAEVRLTSGPGTVVVVDPRAGTVLGSVTVPSGTTRDLSVALDTPVARSGELLVVLHADDGDGRFDAATDGLVVDDESEPVDEELDYRLR